MDWFRWWHGTVTDPKFQWVARKSGQPVGSVIAVWAALLECASTATQGNADATRGNVASFDCTDYDVALGFEDGTVQAIFSAMEQKGLIADHCIAKWNERQPKREDSGNPNTGALSSTERSRLRREKLKREATDATQMQRDATQCNDRKEEKRREEEKKEEKPKRASALSSSDLIADGLTEETANEFLALRRKKGAPLSAGAWKGVKAEAAKAGWSNEAAVAKCLARGWTGFEAEWVQPSALRGTDKFDPVAYVNRNRFAGAK